MGEFEPADEPELLVARSRRVNKGQAVVLERDSRGQGGFGISPLASIIATAVAVTKGTIVNPRRAVTSYEVSPLGVIVK